MSRLTKRTWRFLLVLVAVAAIAAACGDDDDTGIAATTAAATGTTVAPEDVQASAEDVAAGLQKIDGIVRQAAAAVGTQEASATSLTDQIEPIWFSIEGTVKANDPDAYLTFEDAFAALEGAAQKGDPDRATKAAADVQEAVADYLVKYPA